MTREERRIAVAALRAGPCANHDQIVIAVALELRLEPQEIEDVLHRLRVRQVLNCVSTSAMDEDVFSVRYEKGVGWTEV